MRTLPSPLRKQLETAVLAARRAAESAARAAIEGLGVFADRRPEHLDADQAALRNGLRAKWRQGGGDPELLIVECAYEQWHRLLFARFLAENQLLLHPKYRAAVTLADCEELATELGEPDGWSVAARFASEILPGIFPLDDPCVRLRLAPEGRHALEQILDRLPAEVFVADDALGWVYQFWQRDKKDEITGSERKIGGADLGPVTQLFTENYMVRFLLENSLGAWWAARHPASPLVKGFEYLRFGEDGKPAAGSFDGWPDRVAEVTVIDPCCGSGHFLVEAFSMLWQMRGEEERLSSVDAQDAVLRDNLFGLELDSRCVQIAMFAVALQAWKAGDGWRQLPVPNIACSGIPIKAPVGEWKALAGGDERLENALVRLHILFRDADTLGSLIDPKRTAAMMDPSGLQTSTQDIDWASVAPLVPKLVSAEALESSATVLGEPLSALARAADFLSRTYSLVITNVPYLSRQKQATGLAAFLSQHHAAFDGDLATAIVDRCRQLCAPGGTYACVAPDKLLTAPSYAEARRLLLTADDLRYISLLGPRAFQTPMFDLGVELLIASRPTRAWESMFLVSDVSFETDPVRKSRALTDCAVARKYQDDQLHNPDYRLTLGERSDLPLLAKYADSYYGIGTGDYGRYGRAFWEVAGLGDIWIRLQGTVSKHRAYGGRENILRWEQGKGPLTRESNAFIRNTHVWGSKGVLVSLTGSLWCTLYTGEPWDSNCAPIVPRSREDLSAIWAFCISADFAAEVRKIDRSVKVMNHTLLKVPFDAKRWRQIAEVAGPLPEPRSDDPTQWLFEGRPEVSTAPLQVAVGRLVGCRWPEQAESDDLDAFADADAIVCLPSVAGDAPAAERVQQVLAVAFGNAWSPAKVNKLLKQAGSKKKNLDDWLRDDFFKQHCALFGNRPFVWHISDGQRDGFSALVNYHRLDRKMLEKLTYTYLGQDWVERQRAEVREEVAGAEARLLAAQKLQRKLEAILEGEKPYDIYVRWKEPHEQPIGWEPDLNDGVRLNIRPFVMAGVLRAPFNIHWKKDRGKNHDGSERHNDLHLSLAEKLNARKGASRT